VTVNIFSYSVLLYWCSS